MLRLILVGPQGAGKGSAADDLTNKFNIPHISTGDIFRYNIKNQTELGKKIQKIVDGGGLVPSELTCEVMKDRISQDDCKNGYILDGFPRNLEQAKSLDSYSEVDFVVLLDVPREVSIERLTSRLQCSKCKTIFNTKSKPPKKEGVCDKCGGELYRRDDDTSEAITKRLEIYEKETKPILDHYNGKVLVIKAIGDISEVNKSIINAIENAQK